MAKLEILMVEHEIVEENLKQIEAALSNLRRHQSCSFKQLSSDLDMQWIVERGLEVSIQLMFDIGAHILSSRAINDWNEYREIFLQLGKHNVLPSRFALKISGMAGLRNLLAHEYRHLDLRKIHNYLKRDLKDIERFVKHIRAYLEKISHES
jgi:uncharacterized protein YutE (UPF0331/DUF86 family)